MSQPIKVSDALILDARLAGKALERSIAGQVEFWAKLGRSLELLLGGEQVLRLCQSAAVRPLSSCLESVGSDEGRKDLQASLESQPFPHYRALPQRRGLLERTEADGRRTIGRFVNRRFEAVRVTGKSSRRTS